MDGSNYIASVHFVQHHKVLNATFLRTQKVLDAADQQSCFYIHFKSKLMLTRIHVNFISLILALALLHIHKHALTMILHG